MKASNCVTQSLTSVKFEANCAGWHDWYAEQYSFDAVSIAELDDFDEQPGLATNAAERDSTAIGAQEA
jgi:hypothetical protein